MARREWVNVCFQLFKMNEEKPLCVCFAGKIAVDTPKGSEGSNFNGSIEGFFPLMGSVMELISDPGFSGSSNKYVLCFPDVNEEEGKMWKKIVGLRFLESIDSVAGCEKPLFRGRFIADKLVE